MKIYVQVSKIVKGVPRYQKKEVKFEGTAEEKIKDLIKSGTPYFEVVEKGAQTKIVYNKAAWQRNYIKKEVKV